MKNTHIKPLVWKGCRAWKGARHKTWRTGRELRWKYRNAGLETEDTETWRPGDKETRGQETREKLQEPRSKK